MQSKGIEQDMQQLEGHFDAYAVGLYYASACTDLDDQAAVKCMRSQNEMGAWEIAAEPFADGKPNGRPCGVRPATHRHVLFTR